MPDSDYTTLDKVRRIIRSVSGDPSVQKKIKFSDAHSLPKKHSGNSGSGMLLDITISGSYVGNENWKITFTSATGFTLYRGQDELSIDGTGDINLQFISSSKIVTINTTDWTSTIATGDSFTFRTESNISNKDAEGFISDAEDIVNVMLQEFLDPSNVPFTGSVPKQIDTATAYIAAYVIFSSIYSTTNQGDIPELVNRWYRIGSNLVSGYIESIPGILARHAVNIPRFLGREPLFDYVGLTEVAGIGGVMGDKHGKVETTDIGYDKFFNTEEGGD